MSALRSTLRYWLNVLEVLRGHDVVVLGNRLGAALRTSVGGGDISLILAQRSAFSSLKWRGIALLEASSTHVMRRLAVAHGFLQRKHHARREGCGQAIALLLSIPVFHASNL